MSEDEPSSLLAELQRLKEGILAERKRMREKQKRWHDKNLEKSHSIQKKHRDANPEAAAAKGVKWNLGRYGLTLDLYIEMAQVQNGVCKICKRTNGKKRLCVDHDHKSGKTRSLLCDKCNTALGLVNEEPTTLYAMLDYIKEHKGG